MAFVQVVAYENIPTTVLIGGRDYSYVNRPVKVRIVRLPLYGSLKDPATGALLKVGDDLATVLAYPATQNVAIQYIGNVGYFNSPSTDWDGEFKVHGTFLIVHLS